MTRYLARRLSKKTKCELCLSGLKTDGKEIDLPAAQLVNLKTLGFLTHPDNNFYILIKQIEVSFAIHAASANVFEDTVEHFFKNNYNIPFPCSEHKEDVVQYIFSSYLVMRMRQFSYQTNKQKQPSNRVKKKLSKLVSN